MHHAIYVTQPSTTEIKTKNGIDYIIVRKNIKKTLIESLEYTEPSLIWECDENQITIPHGILNLNDIAQNIDKYMSFKYISSQPKTELEQRVDNIEDALIEVVNLFLGGE